jgi:hypothetical protein
MEEAWVRVNRAKATFERLNGEIAAFRAAHLDVPSLIAEYDDDGNVRLIVKVKERPPLEWGLAGGDILVDLRTALDYAVYSLAIAHGGKDPPDHADGLEYPICNSDLQWKQSIGRKKLHGLSDDVVRFIEAQQPFQPGIGGSNAALAVLDSLVGINKHRFIQVAWIRTDLLRLRFRAQGVVLEDVELFPIGGSGELEDGAVLGKFRMVPTSDDPKIEIEPQSLQLFLAIRGTGIGYRGFAGTLGSVGSEVNGNLRALEAFL